MAMLRWDPLSELPSLRQAMDQLFENSIIRPGGGQGLGGLGMPVDVLEQGDAIVVKASLPGVKPDDVNVNIQNNVLTITGEQREERTSAEGRYHLSERRLGSVGRVIALPVAVDSDGAEATFEHGVLTLTLPKAEQARTKQIPIRTRQQLRDDQATNGQQAQPAVAGRS